MQAVYAASVNASDPLAALEVGDVPPMELPAGWARIAVHATTVNHHDIWSLKGVGLSNGTAGQIRFADSVLREHGCRLTAVQNHYSLLAMEREAEALQYCAENGILFCGYMILEQGALSGHYDAEHRLKKLSLRGMAFGKDKFRRVQGLIDYIRELGRLHGVDSSQIPIAWSVSKGVIPIVGLTKPHQALSLNDGLRLRLSDGETAELERLALASGVKCKGIWE